MSYSEPLINQIYRFALSLGFGVIMSVFYELLSCLLLAVPGGKKSIFMRDIVFSVFFTVLSFFFMLVYNEGVVRLNLIIGQLSGLLAFHLTFGKSVRKPLIKLYNSCIFKFKKYKKHKNRI